MAISSASTSDSRVVSVVRFAFRSSKRIAVTVVGGILVLGGIAMLVLPGPGLLVVVAGFAVLGTEYAWAAHALDRTKAAAGKAGTVAKDTAGRSGRAAVHGAGKAGRAAVDGAGKAGRAAKGVADGIGGAVRRRPEIDEAGGSEETDGRR